MSGQKTKKPTDFKVIGNLAPKEVSNPTTTAVFTANHCTLSLRQIVMIDGNDLIPVRQLPE